MKNSLTFQDIIDKSIAVIKQFKQVEKREWGG